MARPPAGVTDDLAVLGDLTEEILLSELKQRYGKDNIYTYVGDILVALNPYKELRIYDKQVSSLL
jgi:myosin-3/myosin XVI